LVDNIEVGRFLWTKVPRKCNETVGKWCKNKHGASKIIDTLDTYQATGTMIASRQRWYLFTLKQLVFISPHVST
jgi:hypothetical protein